MRNMKTLFAAAIAVLIPCAGYAQSSPNLQQGQVLTPAQWNQLFINKQDTLGYTPMSTTGGVFTGRVVTAPPGASTSGFNLTPGSTPASPANGDLWVTSSGFFARVNGTTVGPLTAAGGASFGATTPLSVSFPSGVVTYAITGGTAGQPLLAGSPAAFGALNINSGSVATGAAVTAKYQTTDGVGRANPIKFQALTGLSPLFGLPYNGYASLVNFSGDGSFTSNEQEDVRLLTWDRTSDHGTVFLNPVSVPIYDDSTYYKYFAQNIAFVSKNQSVATTCFETAGTGYTVSGGQVTAVGTVPAGCTGNIYVPSTSIVVQLYPSPGFGTGCQFTANVNGSGAIASYSGLPCGSGLSAANTSLYFQPPQSACPNNGCILDVGPQVYISRQTQGYWAASGSFLGSILFSGPSNNANTIGTQVAYTSIASSVVDPSISSPKGAGYLSSASVFTLNAGNTPRVGWGQGLFMTNSVGSPLADPGEGNIAAYQFTIASASNQIAKWTLFSNSSANTLDIYNVGAAAIAWTFGTNNGFYSAVATGGNQGAGTINATGVYVNGVAVVAGAPAAGTLTGTTLASNVVTSSLTTVGTLNNLSLSGVVSGSGNIPLSVLGTQAANTIVANGTSGTVSPTAMSVASCSAAGSALKWTTDTGIGCNSSITAAAVPVGGITGLGTGVAAWLATPSSANLAAALTDETGSSGGGVAVFSNSPAITTPAITGLPTGSGIATANTVSTLVARDGSGNFSAGTITAALIGNASTASAVAASGITGTTLASGVVTSSLTTVGTLIGGATGAGFTVALATSTITGTLPCANHPALTGDVTTSSCAATLATVATAGTTGSSTAIPVVTINVKGLVTSVTTAAVVAPAGTLSGATLAAGVTSSSLTSLGTITALSAINATIGAGGTGASTLTQLLVNGASGSGSGPYIQFNKNSVSKWQFGVASTQGGVSDDFVFFGATVGTNAMTIGASDNRVTFGAQAFHPSVASDTATTDSTACIKAADGQLLKGTGTLGICLGTSGRQFKTAFEPMHAGMNEIAKLALWNYRYKRGFGDDGARVQYGPTAQDVEDVIPDLVRHNERGEAINYDIGAFVPISLRALQQLNERIKTLENRR